MVARLGFGATPRKPLATKRDARRANIRANRRELRPNIMTTPTAAATIDVRGKTSFGAEVSEDHAGHFHGPGPPVK